MKFGVILTILSVKVIPKKSLSICFCQFSVNFTKFSNQNALMIWCNGIPVIRLENCSLKLQRRIKYLVLESGLAWGRILQILQYYPRIGIWASLNSSILHFILGLSRLHHPFLVTFCIQFLGKKK